MRTSNLRGLRAAFLGAAVIVAACGASASPTPPAPTETPLPTPTRNPHLSDPALLDDVFRGLTRAGLVIRMNNGDSGTEPLRRINGSFMNWPLSISEYSSAAALRATTRFDPITPIRLGDAPYVIVGLNILVEYGPKVTNAAKPEQPDPAYSWAALQLADALDPLVGPLQQRAVEPLALPTLTPQPTLDGSPVPIDTSPPG